MGTKKAKLIVVDGADLVWRSGKPKASGWYNASRTYNPDTWRWFDGKRWSRAFTAHRGECPSLDEINAKAYTDRSKPILYRTYWPENASIPRPKGR